MSCQLSENRTSLPATVLSALVLGLVLCPLGYVAIYAPLLFLFREPAFWFVGLLLMLIGGGYLLFRLLGKPKEPASGGVWLIAEILSWFVIAVFITIFATNIPIPFGSTSFDLIATFFTFFLLASLLSLPVVLMRKTALQQRLMKLPDVVVTPLVVLVVPVSTAIVIVAELLCPPPYWFMEFAWIVLRIPFFTFFTTFERFSVVLLIFFLLASMFSLSVLLMRKTVFKQRLMKLPNIVNTLLLVLLGLVVLILAAIVVFHLLCPYPLFWYG